MSVLKGSNKYVVPVSERLLVSDVKRLLDHCITKPQLYSFIVLSWLSGARPSELVGCKRTVKRKYKQEDGSVKEKIVPIAISGLRGKDVYVIDNVLHIHLETLKLREKDKKRGLNYRTIRWQISEGDKVNGLAKYVADNLAGKPEDARLFTHCGSWYLWQFRELCRDVLHKPYSLYHLRHSFFSYHDELGASIGKLKDLKGAKSVESLIYYIHGKNEPLKVWE